MRLGANHQRDWDVRVLHAAPTAYGSSHETAGMASSTDDASVAVIADHNVYISESFRSAPLSCCTPGGVCCACRGLEPWCLPVTRPVGYCSSDSMVTFGASSVS